MRHIYPIFCRSCPSLQEEMLHPLPPSTEFSEGHDGCVIYSQGRQRQLRQMELVKNISCNLIKYSIAKLMISPHKTSPYAHKTTPIFTAITHNTTVGSLNQHMFCDLQGIARSS